MSLFHAPGRFIAETLTWLPTPPHRSLLLLRLHEIDCWPQPYVVVEAIRRHDLYLVLDYPATVAIVTSALQISDRYRPDAMAAVIIDSHRDDDQTGPVAVHRELTELLRDRLAENGTDLIAAWSVVGTTPGSAWISLFDDDHGTLPSLPPTATATSNDIPASAGGIRPHTATAERVAAELARHQQPPISTAGPDGARDRSRQRVRLVLGWARQVHNGATVTIAGLAAMAEALQDSDVRDVLFAFTVGPHGEAASPLWMVLARCLPARHRGRPALLLAVTTYLSGRRERAMTELRYGLADSPDDPTLLAMARAFADRVPAEVLHAVARSGRATAADLGIDLD
ncbi:DUF4192 domain-containing protein [Nocardia cyriacigeorgica]|uniref:DUF4192 family protein n=1 Tax=Nocardia cyriacigeorgica TaxID=135487 RepID=UPI001895B6A1|nr:DUF4192 family protein [Nocardia cyriacigeorgica]MBF6102259.1 DUF4192 domain-containing protein [Nocardia cyriacigeorgica]